jgi:hypothetical protein
MSSCLRGVVVCGLKLLLVAAVLSIASTAARSAPPGDAQPSLQALIQADWVDQDRLAAMPKPAATAKPAVWKVTTVEDATGGCDGIKTGAWGFHTASGERDPWWQVDLGKACRLDRVVLFNRCDVKGSRTARIEIAVADGPKAREFKVVYRHDGQPFGGVKDKKPLVVSLKEKDVTARVVRLQVAGRCSFALDEVEVYGVDNPKKNIALGRPADQKSVGTYSYPPAVKRQVTGVAAIASLGGGKPAVPPADGGFKLSHTRQVIERGRALAARLKPQAEPQRLAPLAAELEKLSAELTRLEKTEDPPKGKGDRHLLCEAPEGPFREKVPVTFSRAKASDSARREIYLAARGVVRGIAFTNPRLGSIPRLVFVKRHDAEGVYHMCDQYYGCNAVPGGGLYVLDDPFGRNPRLVNLLAHSVVANGRLKGQKLEGGSFLSPDVSYDGRQILFAYSEAKAYAKTQGKEAYLWAPEYSFHLFKVNADGSGLVQLTDGPADDFDPCWLPGGRVAFVSERRGGYLRCGRHCPTYTLFSMAADGSDIVCLSYHETHEWHPSVNQQGMLVYTRWDYVDRDSDIAHHIWTSYPDGRDPRSFHGNYPEKRESRPWMEMDIRAIPGSHKYVATAAAHHGHAFGSLVLIDPRIRDDNSTSQLTRLTPEVPFPESEGGKREIRQHMIYATAWPLGEDDYLCAYDWQATNHGIYWIDRAGNRELVYRDPKFVCQSPMPLAARPRPPVIPDGTTQTAAAREAHGSRPASVAVMNVYESDFAWPKDTKITALRVIQLLPKSTAPPNEPRIGAATQTNARAVLGTVPVESDGSAYFEAPVGKAIYFQAIDARGMAVQSMRSATYLHPGEQLVCRGCHEGKHAPPDVPGKMPLALRRLPSKIEPDAEGSNPFSYVRLVQPVLDRNCVACHQEKKAVDLTGVLEGKHGWSRSYANLAEKYGFYFQVSNGSINLGVHGGSRSIAGQFGAQAAPLAKYLGPGHHGVKLSDDDLHRMTLWLDCNSEFYGSYENIEAQAQGKVVRPTLE